MILMLGSLVYAIIESGSLGWTSPVILGLLAVALVSGLGILGYERRRPDPLLELLLFRSLPFSAAILMVIWALCAFGSFLFVTTQYLRDVRGMSALTTGLCLLPVGVLVVAVPPRIGRVVGTRGPRLPLVIAGVALALGGGASICSDRPRRCRSSSPSTCSSGCSWAASIRRSPTPQCPGPRSMAGVASSLASTGGQIGTSLGVAISGAIVGRSLALGATAFTGAEHVVWWLVLGLGAGIVVLGLVSTGR